jgi:hypothetical protein
MSSLKPSQNLVRRLCLATVASAQLGQPLCLAGEIAPSLSTTDNFKHSQILRGEVSQFASPVLSQQIQNLIELAEDKTDSQTNIKHSCNHFGKPIHRLIASSKDLAELATAYKGFEQSSEAADVILEEKVKLKSRASATYARQKQLDDIQLKVVTALMQIATGYGVKDKTEGDGIVKEGVEQLAELVGQSEAEKSAQVVADWCHAQQQLPFPDCRPLHGPLQVKAECDKALARAMQNDPTCDAIKDALHKYNGRSKLARTTAKVLNTSLSIAAFSPTFVSPAAQVAWGAYIMTQGGPEEAKLIKEVYLAKRFESRWHMLNEEASLAVNGYNAAVYAQNPGLLSFCQFLLARMGGREEDESAEKESIPASPKAPAENANDGKKEANNDNVVWQHSDHSGI